MVDTLMAHFAEIDENNIVVRVIVLDDSKEANGAKWCKSRLGGTWVQTSRHTSAGVNSRNGAAPIRKNYAGPGYTYDKQRDAFIPPKSYQSWELDEETCVWKAPVQEPKDGKSHYWDEDRLAWAEDGK